MNQKPIILVTGATGAQGGSVARALLSSNTFTVRCLTRNTSSEKAIALAQMGAVLVQGDLENVESLKEAMEGCYAVFGVTNFWEHYEKEYQQGKNLVDAVSQSGIRHFIFSTLPDYLKLSNSKLPVPHCDIKAALEQYTSALKIPSTFIHVAFYYENFLSFFPLQKGEDGNYYFGFPQGNTPLAMVSTEDLGGVVTTILNHPHAYIGRTVGVVGEDRTCTEYAAIMSKVLGANIYYNYIPRETFAAFDFSGAEELANMFEVQRLYVPGRRNHLIETYGLYPSTQSFEQWLQKNKALFNIQSAFSKEVLSL